MTPKALKPFIGIEVVMQDPASCYAGTMEALIFRLACLEDKEFESKAKKRCWKSLLSLDIVVYLLNSEQNDEVCDATKMPRELKLVNKNKK